MSYPMSEKILPCPMPGCDGRCWCEADDIDDKMQDRPPYWIRCKECHYQYGRGSMPHAIAAHNELCELVEKGRDVPTLISAMRTERKRLNEALSQHDEAVRLLRDIQRWRNEGRPYNISLIRRTDTFLARIDKGGGE